MAQIETQIVLETLHTRICRDVEEALKFASPIEVTGVLWNILFGVTKERQSPLG